MRTTIFRIAAGALALTACDSSSIHCPSGELGEEICSELDPATSSDAGVGDDAGEGLVPDAEVEPDSSAVIEEDAAAACSPSAPDPIDDLALDTNCDDVDGVAERLLFVSLQGDDGAPGTPRAPLRTLKAAISRAAAESLDGVLVAAGIYEECDVSLDVATVRLFGGYTPADGAWTQRTLAEPTVVRTSFQGLRFQGLVHPSHIEGVRIEAASGDEPEFCATEELPPSGRTSTGLTLAGVENSTPVSVVLRHAEIQAGMGGNGAAGAAGTPSANGVRGRAGCPGGPGCPATPVNAFGFFHPGASAPTPPSCGDASRIKAGAGGSAEDGDTSAGRPGASGATAGGAIGSGAGAHGRVGRTGSDGAGGTVMGRFSLGLGYEPATAASGERGQAGEGGGGGGPTIQPPLDRTCPMTAAPGYVRVEGTITFGSGGSGGTGGCGGASGRGGQGGGASVGVVLSRAAVTLVNASVRAEEGGRGGKGGDGAAGGGGGTGGAGGIEVCSPYTNGRFYHTPVGGRGGAGGDGGAGGHGGGGAGGPSFGALLLPGAELDSTNGLVEAGDPGLGGASSGHAGARGLAQAVFTMP